MSNYATPGQMRTLRACMICAFVQTTQVSSLQHDSQSNGSTDTCFFSPPSPSQKFKQNGCPNCEQLLQNLGHDVIEDITSHVFEGLIALREPTKSWVARWQRIEKCEKGVYAVKVSGNVSSTNIPSPQPQPQTQTADLLARAVAGRDPAGARE